MNSDRNIINIIDKWDAKVTDWLDEKYPTAIYHFVVGLFGFAVLVGHLCHREGAPDRQPV